MATPEKVRIGGSLEAFPGRSFNALIDQHYRVAALLGRNNKAPSGPGQILIVKARNLTGVALNYGHCVAIEEVAIAVADQPVQVYGRPLLKANKPTASLKHQIMGVALTPIAVDSVGSFITAGPAWLRCNYTDTDHNFVALKPNQVTFTELADSGDEGYPILAREESGTGEQWVLALLLPPGVAAGNVIYAQVNAPSGVTSGDPTFPFDNAVAIVGSIPSGGAGTAQNQYAQTYADNEFVILSQRKDNQQWLTERGGASGSQVVYGELTQDKSYADVSKLAKPVLEDGTLDSGADAFHVVDEFGQYYGKAATGGEDGYRGFFLRFTDDYNSTGVPGFRIIMMEGPAHLLLVTLAGPYSISGTPCTIGADQIWGRPSRGRRLPASGTVTVEDDNDVAISAQTGDKWLVAWDEADEHYIFVVSLQGGGHNGIRGTLDTDLTEDMDDVTVNVIGFVGASPGATVLVKNPPNDLHPDAPGKYLFIGNAGGWCVATQYSDGWHLDGVQAPVTRPV